MTCGLETVHCFANLFSPFASKSKSFFTQILHFPASVVDMQANFTHSDFTLFTDDKYHLQNYPPINSDQSQHGHHFTLNQYKAVDHQSGQPVDEPNNNSKNNSSASSYDEAIDYDDSIQNHDLKDSQMSKKSPTDAGDGLKYIKNFANRYDEHQATYNGNANASEDYRMTNIDERKMNDDGNSSMNYASSDEMNQNAATSDHGEKLGSGSEDEGKRHCCESIEKSIPKQTFSQTTPARRKSTGEIEQLSRHTSCTSWNGLSRKVIIPTCIRGKSWR